MAAAVATEEQDERGKVFQWARERRGWLHLMAFLLFSIVVHGSGFYLFKVVYPSPVRVENEPDSITIMDASDTAVRSVLQRISDRTIFLLPPSAQSDVRLRLESRSVRFTPAFQRTELELIPPSRGKSFPGPMVPLDSLASLEERRPSDLGVNVKLSPSLVDRPVAPWSIMEDYLSNSGGLPFLRINIEVSPEGAVRVTGVEAELEESEKAELASVIESTLRFVASPETGAGWVEIGGEG